MRKHEVKVYSQPGEIMVCSANTQLEREPLNYLVVFFPVSFAFKYATHSALLFTSTLFVLYIFLVFFPFPALKQWIRNIRELEPSR